MVFDRDEMLAKYEALDDDRLHELDHSRITPDPKKRALIKQVLRNRQQQRTDEVEQRNAAAITEQTAIARAAKDAAERQAAEAEKANEKADKANYIAEHANKIASRAFWIAVVSAGVAAAVAVLQLLSLLSK